MIVLGIDPGRAGALAWCHSSGGLVAVADMPVVEVRGKTRVSAAELARLMGLRQCDLVVIEGVHAIPRRTQDGREVGMGAASSFSFGYSAGIIEGVAAGLGMPIQIVAAASWKRRAQVPRDKGACRAMAQRLWPNSSRLFSRVKDEGRADASLLAHWMAVHMGADVAVRQKETGSASRSPLVGA